MTGPGVEDTALFFRERPVIATLGGIAVYLVLDYVSFLEAFRGMAITPWSPGSGFALALVLLAGASSAGVVLCGPPLAGLLVRSGVVPLPMLLLEGVTLGGCYLLVGVLARHFARIDSRLQSVYDVLVLMLTALAAAAVAALSYVGVLGLMSYLAPGEILEAFGRFLLGDLIGMLIVTPAALLAASRHLRQMPAMESLALLSTIVLALAIIFLVPHSNELQLFYLLFVPLIWSALRGGISGVAITLCVIQIGLIATVRAPFTTASSIVPFQILMIWLASTGWIIGVVVTQQRATATRLHYQQLALGRALRGRAMGEVATSIAHEVNQPLTSIKALAGVLRRELTKPPSGACIEIAEKIRSECDRASRIIRATRDALRQKVHQPEPIDVAQLLSELENLVVDRLSALNVRLSMSITADASVVSADRTQISQALYNLLDNSLQAIEESGKPGTVTIRVTRPAGNEVEFEIRDTGPGMPDGAASMDLPPLFSTKAYGSGIGLSIARSVAEAHGGRLTLQRREGETCAYLTIAGEA